MSHDREQEPLSQGWGLPMGFCVGAAIGLLFGLMLDQLALGIAFGAAIGLVVGATATNALGIPVNRRRAVVAAAIALIAAGLTAVVLAWLA